MTAAVASPPLQAPPQEAPPVTQLWDELCAAPQPPPPKRVVICGSTTRLVELARAALSDDEVQAECATVGCCAVSAVEGAETWQVVGRPAVAADLVRPESAVGGALRAASHSAAVVVVDGGDAPAAALQSWLTALDGAPTLVIAFGGSRLGALRRRCGDAGVALAALREAGDATMRATLREALMALLTGAASPASRYDGDEAFYAPGEAALDAPDGDDGVVEELAAPPTVIEDRDAWLQNLANRAGDHEAPATPTAAAAAAAPTPESSNARSFFEGLLNSPGK